ncbi:hypothetical protein HYPBUDRAFT_145773 [Hyphopichia burtonii NRRL Y-1933]|uniref:Uncharacterized protein n=1 Tax=Hyphopichia burtonii NRRL Y-1933 TaxID=984485 RepID=A0A1E4RPZ9_9ASCO|nr:hypothetical protein HYPBUDRAFT_145773 [Hyphopichia burtonii NRRL Y-1933]ODV69350.1 hypothetical protein HYPBUDRAFT_145773 [Hyphopichia burtonii NRRL Y-1933]
MGEEVAISEATIGEKGKRTVELEGSVLDIHLHRWSLFNRSLTWEVSDDVFHCNQWGRPAGPPFGSNFVSISLGSGAPWKFALGPQQFDKARIQKAIGDLVSK